MRSVAGQGGTDASYSGTGGSAGATSHRIGRFLLEDLIVGDASEGLWRANDDRLARAVAVRLVPATDPRQEDLRAAACAAARVVDRRVVRVLDVLDHEGTLVVVSEWIDGLPLEQLLATPVLPERALSITRAIAAAIEQIHAAGTTHGRLTPANVMITPEGEVRVRGHCIDAKLWGVAPGHDPAAADVHALGAVLMACLTSRWPGSPATGLRPAPIVGGKMTTPAQLVADLPPGLDDFAVRALAAVPGPQTIAVTQPFTTIWAARQALATVSAINPPPPSAPVGALADDGGGRARKLAKRTVGVLIGLAVTLSVAALGSQLFLPSGGSAASVSQLGAQTRPAQATPRQPSSVAAVGGLTPATADEAGSAPERGATSEPSAETALPIATISTFEAAGTASGDGGARLAIDDNPASAWYTDTSDKKRFGNGKGRGLIIDLGSSRLINAVELGLVGNNTDLQIRTADTLGDSVSDFKKISAVRGAPGRVILREPRPVIARYVLVWLTGVPSTNDGYRGGISNLQVRGE